MPRLCILTQYFPPEMGAPQARLSELGERLIDLGWCVEVLTALPNYPTGAIFAGYDPRHPVVESIGRIQTVRVPLYTAKSGFVKRIRSYFSFVASARRYGPRLCHQPDLLFVESPPLFIGYAGRYLSRRWKCPYVFNVSDLWPEAVIRLGMIRRGLLAWLAERLELSIYRKAAGVIGQSTETIESICGRVPKARTQVITNGVDPRKFGPDKATETARQLLGPDPGPVFVFAGLFGWAQGLDQVLDLALSLPADVPGRFVLIGDGPLRPHLENRIRAESIPRVKILSPEPLGEIPGVLAAADVALISLGMYIPGAVPSKIYEAMASSLPILLIADGEPARRVAEAGCGLTVSPGDVTGAQLAFRRLATDQNLRLRLGKEGRNAARISYDRNHLAGQLNYFLRSVLAIR